MRERKSAQGGTICDHVGFILVVQIFGCEPWDPGSFGYRGFPFVGRSEAEPRTQPEIAPRKWDEILGEGCVSPGIDIEDVVG